MFLKNNSIEYYEQNAEEYVAATLNVDMSAIYTKFLDYIPSGGSILDAGCGSGRDTKYFLDHGYKVTAIDGSAEMAARTYKLTGIKVRHQNFCEINDSNAFDGIWACASILHVSKAEMVSIINKLCSALTEGGTLYLSYKYGENEETRSNRHFSNYTEQSFHRLLQDCDSLRIIDMWTTQDVRPDRQDEQWLNVLLSKSG